MNCRGFRLYKTPRGAELEFVMPRELEGIFFARLFARGELNDRAEGDPSRLWETLGRDYGARPLVAPRQVHGVNIIGASPLEALPSRSEADGVFIRAGRAELASLRVADCAPVVVAGTEPSFWMAILHSGFKGTLLNITSAAFARVNARGAVWAWIGPHIGPCCYSRRSDDPASLDALGAFSDKCVRREDGLYFFNIGAEIERQLVACGADKKNIFRYRGCTVCEKELFYSYRAGDKEKRNFLLAGSATISENM